jgi:hypothetical protein
MPQSQASLEERLRRMAENAATVKTAAEALREAAAQPEAGEQTRTVNLVPPPASPLTQNKR